MGRLARLLLATVLCGALVALGSAGGAGAEGGGSEASLVPWVPSESWAGGKQYDPRLEKTVEFWGAGMPLGEVFAGVREQTGVEIGFWPPGDMNERVCVTLYLNPEQPPTLRELMAQVSWVTDCAFAVSSDEEEEASYCLLATSMAGGALRRLQAEQDAGVGVLRARREQLRSENREKLAGKLPEVRRALQLSREELVERYRGMDDLLLLAMLEPRRRSIVEFVLGLLADDLHTVLAGPEAGLVRPWAEWSPEQRRTIGELFELGRGYWASEQDVRALEEGSLRWEDELPLSVTVQGTASGGLRVIAHPPDYGEGTWMSAGGVGIAGEIGSWPEDVAALREVLGNPLTPDERTALLDRAEQQRQAEARARRQESMKERLEERLAAQRPLTPEAKGLLSSSMLPEAFADERALWQIQEAAAAESGMHVVSDCFWQPGRDLREVVKVLYPERAPEMTGLLAVRLSALSTVKPERILYSYASNDRAGWEWEDAGEFLRFRHVARDLWRAAFLPEGRLRELDEWLKPYVAGAVESERDEITIAVSLDIRQGSRIARQLDDFQLYHGGKVIYRDPADVEEAYRQRLREEVLAAISRWAGLYRLFGTFTEQQWEGLCGPGLRWSADLTPAQQAMEVSSYLDPLQEELPDATVRLTEGGPTEERGGGDTPVVRDTYVVEFVERGESARELPPPGDQATSARRAVPEVHLPRTVVVRLKRPARLVAAPDTAGTE